MPDPGRQNEQSHPPRLSDLFDNLPTAGSQLPQPDWTPARAGSRRAARQAREAASGAIPVVQPGQRPATEAPVQHAQPQAPAQQVPAQQVPAQQVPAQQVPAQQVPTQQVPTQQVPAQQAPAQAPAAASQSRFDSLEPRPVDPLSTSEPAQRAPEVPSITGPFSITVTGSHAIAQQPQATAPIMSVPAFPAAAASQPAASAAGGTPLPTGSAAGGSPQPAASAPEPAPQQPATPTPQSAAPAAEPAQPQADPTGEPDGADALFGGGSEGPTEFDSLFAPESHREHKKKRGKGCLISLIVLLAILGGIAGAGAWVYNTYSDKINEVMGWGPSKDYEPGQEKGEAFVTIKDGDTGQPISTALHEAGVTKTPSVFYDMLVDENLAVTFYPGVYKLKKQMTADAALKALRDEKNRMANTASVPEGGQIKNFLPTVAESLGMPLEDLQAAVKNPADYGVQAQNLEGWLFPAVYTYDPGVSAKDVIQKMVDRTRQSLKDAGVAAGDEERILTIASIVQREGHTADFDKVSRVIDNRLRPDNDETHGLLQMDSTAQYGYGLTHDGKVSSWPWKAVSTDSNPWNTYVHTGLPVGPISSPSDAAIKAAQNPAEGTWYYFVTVNLDTGETVFSTTYEEQQAAERKYQQWCKDNPDGGCY